MSTNPIRKPSAASESFITALAALFFIFLGILFLWLDNRKTAGDNVQKIETSRQNHISLHTENSQETIVMSV